MGLGILLGGVLFRLLEGCGTSSCATPLPQVPETPNPPPARATYQPGTSKPLGPGCYPGFGFPQALHVGTPASEDSGVGGITRSVKLLRLREFGSSGQQQRPAGIGHAHGKGAGAGKLSAAKALSTFGCRRSPGQDRNAEKFFCKDLCVIEPCNLSRKKTS